MTEHRWTKFWWQDWQADQSLRSCSLAARGLWMDMLCIAHSGTPRGHVTINGAPVSARRLATLTGCTARECVKLLNELREAGVFSETSDGVIYSRRMVRDNDASEAGREAIGKRWQRAANPNTTPNRVDDSLPTTLEAEADTEAESKKERPPQTSFEPPQPDASPSAPPTTPRRVGCRIPDDWTPADPDFAAQHGVDHGAALAEFRDYWRGVAGKAGVKLDWEATWRNQVRHVAAKPKRQGYPLKTSQLPVPDQNAELLRMMNRLRTEEPETPYPALRIAQ